MQEERHKRNQALSSQIKQEYQASVQPLESWLAQSSLHALSIAVFIVGALAVTYAPLKQVVAQVPWQYMPAAIAETSVDAYDATFMVAAYKYLEVVDVVGDVQAQSYLTIGKGASMAASATLSSETVGMLQYFPEELAELLVDGWVDMHLWYATAFVEGTYAVSDALAFTYQAVFDTMQESSNTMADIAASAVYDAKRSVAIFAEDMYVVRDMSAAAYEGAARLMLRSADQSASAVMAADYGFTKWPALNQWWHSLEGAPVPPAVEAPPVEYAAYTSEVLVASSP